MSGPVLCLAGHQRGELSEITLQVLSVGRRLADELGASLVAVAMSDDVSAVVAGLGAADAVFALEGQSLAAPTPSQAAALLADLALDKSASLVLIGSTNASMGIGPALATRLDCTFVNFCADLRVENGSLLVTSRLFGGKILAASRVPEGMAVISVHPGAFAGVDAGSVGQAPPVERIVVPAEQPSVAFLGYRDLDAEDLDITRFDVLVAVGRGIESEENLELAEELAETLGAAVCASRPVVDHGWLPLSRQVGRSGRVVKPQCYLAFGISGAPEHVEGMHDAELVIAVNTDPSAPIFEVAHYGATGDLFDIIPALAAAVRERKG